MSKKQTPEQKAKSILADLDCNELRKAKVRQAADSIRISLEARARTRQDRFKADVDETILPRGNEGAEQGAREGRGNAPYWLPAEE